MIILIGEDDGSKCRLNLEFNRMFYCLLENHLLNFRTLSDALNLFLSKKKVFFTFFYYLF